MELSEELIWRGFKYQTTVNNITDLDKKSRKFYIGFDPSADSLTIGNLASMMMARCFIRAGYTPYLLVGGATGMIGDPKDTNERDLKTIDEIEHNKAIITTQFKQVVGGEVNLVDNYDWFKDIKLLDFLREVGKQFSMTQMLDREFVKARVGDGKIGLSYAEFSYVLIQSYDFLHLYRTYGVDLQLCGADQWGNSVSGRHLIKRLENADVDVWSAPLVIDPTTGVKFGKSETGAVWLSEAKTSAYNFYQFWLNVDDAGVENYLKIYTELSKDEIDGLLAKQRQDPSKRPAQKALAYEVTKIVHGQAKADSVVKITTVLFGGSKIDELSADELDLLAEEIPTIQLGFTIVEALQKTSLASSNSEAKRLLESGAININGEKVFENTEVKELSLLKKGRNSFVLIK